MVGINDNLTSSIETQRLMFGSERFSVSKTLVAALGCCLIVGNVSCESDSGGSSGNTTESERSEQKAGTESDDAAYKLVPLNKQETVLLDKAGNRLLLKTTVVLREGLLEMLCCRTQSKEHESILAVDADARIIHGGLLALNARPGHPVKFVPEFQPPEGQKIDIFLQWTDERGKLNRVPAQNWIRGSVNRYYVKNLKSLPSDLKIPEELELRWDEKHRELYWYGPMTPEQRDRMVNLSRDEQYREAIRSFFQQSQPRQMQARWVFAGSFFEVDEQTGQQFYMAEGGDYICVANFPTAMIDIAMDSTASGESNLLFETYTERIPPLETQVVVELIPVKEE